MAEPQQGELRSLASVIIMLSYRPPPPTPICTHYTAKPRHAIFPYARPLGTTHAHSLSLSLYFVFGIAVSAPTLHVWKDKKCSELEVMMSFLKVYICVGGGSITNRMIDVVYVLKLVTVSI